MFTICTWWHLLLLLLKISLQKIEESGLFQHLTIVGR